MSSGSYVGKRASPTDTALSTLVLLLVKLMSVMGETAHDLAFSLDQQIVTCKCFCRSTMISDLILATERLKTEKKYLSKMVTKLVEENQKLLGENRHFREKITRADLDNPEIKTPVVITDLTATRSPTNAATRGAALTVLQCQPMEQKEVHSESPVHEVAKANLVRLDYANVPLAAPVP
ncbi:hypothetical protein UY3_12734 [Chelonia mydas]|uniref:Uncharacterized protein n=1 Tax=Chelonia mydas TaxID=8469 RepID=M7AXA8_CHEMY|nr:hypothetical protein UY3_12734 [Chelonia mydas]